MKKLHLDLSSLFALSLSLLFIPHGLVGSESKAATAAPSPSPLSSPSDLDRLVKSRLPATWKMVIKSDEIRVWRESATTDAVTVSASVYPLTDDKSHTIARTSPNPFQRRPAMISRPLSNSMTAEFAKSRREKAARAGLSNWLMNRTTTLWVPVAGSDGNGVWAVEIEGTYQTPSGAHVCFVERQVERHEKLLQTVATRRTKKGPCAWNTLAQALNQIINIY